VMFPVPHELCRATSAFRSAAPFSLSAPRTWSVSALASGVLRLWYVQTNSHTSTVSGIAGRSGSHGSRTTVSMSAVVSRAHTSAGRIAGSNLASDALEPHAFVRTLRNSNLPTNGLEHIS
jgi:hypothetical protein